MPVLNFPKQYIINVKGLYGNLTQRNYDYFVSGRNKLVVQNFKDKKKYNDSFSGKIHSWESFIMDKINGKVRSYLTSKTT